MSKELADCDANCARFIEKLGGHAVEKLFRQFNLECGLFPSLFTIYVDLQRLLGIRTCNKAFFY